MSMQKKWQKTAKQPKNNDDTPMMGSLRWLGEKLRMEEGTSWSKSQPQSKMLTQTILDKATQIYFKHAWGRAPTKNELHDIQLADVTRQLNDGHSGYTFSCRYGCQDICAGNMKLEITHSMQNDGRFVFYVYENDFGCPEKFHAKNMETVRRIESEWAKNGILVNPPRKD